MKRYFLPLVLFLIIFISYNAYTENDSYNIKCYLTLKKKIYELGEPITVDFYIKNTGNETLQLRISDEFYYNYSFFVKSVKNRIIEEKDEFYNQKEDNAKNVTGYKKVNLAKGQIYGQTIELTNIYDFTKADYYVVKGLFYPVPYNLNSDIKAYDTPYVELKVQPNQYRIEEIEKDKSKQEKQINSTKAPEDTISLYMESLKGKKWDNLFKCLDLEKFIIQYPEYLEKYEQTKPSKRYKRLKEFQKYLIEQFSIEDILTFDIYKTVSEKNKANVYCDVEYRYNKVKFKRRYNFSLYKKNNIWYIESYNIVNL